VSSKNNIIGEKMKKMICVILMCIIAVGAFAEESFSDLYDEVFGDTERLAFMTGIVMGMTYGFQGAHSLVKEINEGTTPIDEAIWMMDITMEFIPSIDYVAFQKTFETIRDLKEDISKVDTHELIEETYLLVFRRWLKENYDE
jgi:hypothetical protein